MPLALNCNNTYNDDKGKARRCGQVEPYMDPKTEQVFCPLCNQEMVVTHFTKVTLKNLKQFRQKPTVPFGVKCQSCGKEAQPKIVNDDIVCPGCNKKHEHLSEPFKIMLKDKLKTTNKDV
jgi:Zn finger protein HypA/HybF involved in hydrogenase expression